MGHYDFIAFENYRQAHNHKIDVLLIAKLLQYAGMKVAILDIYHEDRFNEIEGIPVIHHHVSIPTILEIQRPKNPIKRILHRINYFFKQYDYMARVRDEISNLADFFYCGSYHVDMDSAWFELKKPCYWWGLRSNRFELSKEHFKADKFTFFRIPYLKCKFLKNNYQRLFVSNEIIRQEFLNLGIPKHRIIIREERVIDKIGDSGYNCLSEKISFLSIGQLRPQKRVEKVINAFLSLKDEETKYFIVGRSSKEYESVLKSSIGKSQQVERIIGFLEYSDFLNFFKKSHFVVFADEPIKGTVTNGTMLEALINYRPIIAPNYNPYLYYIEKYNVGIIYNPNIPGDLTRAMKDAINLGCKHFELAIKEFLKTIKFDRVSKNLCDNIRDWKK